MKTLIIITALAILTGCASPMQKRARLIRDKEIKYSQLLQLRRSNDRINKLNALIREESLKLEINSGVDL